MSSPADSTAAPLAEAHSHPARVLGPIDATSVVVGAIIGVGIFFTPSRVVNLTGSGGLALATWAIAGAIALCGALTFAELGRRYHASGAQYEILRDSYGPLPAFLFVFCNATAIQAGAVGIIAVVCVRNLAPALGYQTPEGWPLIGIAAGLILGLITANIVGVRWGARIQNFTVFAKVATLLIVTGLAVFASPAVPGTAAPTGAGLGALAGITAALVPAFFSYGGWQHALWISGEVRDPQRNLPRAIVGGVLLVVAVYLLANWAYLRLLGADAVAASTALAADAVGTVWKEAGGRAVGAAVALSAFGVLNAQLLSGPRLVYGMARDGRFFRVFGSLSPRFRTPVAAIVLIGGMGITLLAVAGPEGVDKLLTGAVFIDGVFFAMTGAALFVLRRKGTLESGRDAGFAVPGYPVVPALFVLGEIGVVVGAYLDAGVRQAAYLGAAWIAAGVVLYLLRFRNKTGAPAAPRMTCVQCGYELTGIPADTCPECGREHPLREL